MIPGWKKSEGANKEFKRAAELELTCLNTGITKWLFDLRVMMYKSDLESGDMQTIKDMMKIK